MLHIQPPRGRRLGLATLLLVLPAGCDPVRYTEAFVPDAGITAVRIEVDDGNIELVAGDALRVERSIRAPEGALDLSHHVEGGTLVLSARCRSLVPCAVDTRVDVPDGLPVQVSLADGEVWATGLSQLDLSIADGSADLDIRDRLAAQVGTGRVRARLGEGAQARITVAKGDIDVTVPTGPWQVDTSAARVEASGIQPDDEALGRLQLIAPGGAVQLRGQAPLANR